MSFVVVKNKLSLLDKVLKRDKLDELMFFAPSCLPAIRREIDGKMQSDIRAVGEWGEKFSATLTGGKVFDYNKPQCDVYSTYTFEHEKGVYIESKVRTNRKNGIQIDPFHQKEIERVLNGEIEKLIFTYLINPDTGLLEYIYADDAKFLFDPKNQLLGNQGQQHRQMIYITKKFKSLSTCIYDLDKVKATQSGNRIY